MNFDTTDGVGIRYAQSFLINWIRQGGRMLIDEQTESFLKDRMQFTPSHIKRLEKNASLLSNTLGLINC